MILYMFSYSIIIPFYNEEANLSILTKEINEYLSNNIIYEIVFIDDGSTDNSYKEAQKLISKYQKINFNLLNNLTNQGQSYSITKGIKIAKYENIITIDADCQNNPKDINNLIEIYEKNKFKLIGGIRTKRKDNIIKIYSSILANLVRRILLNDNCKDTGCSLKVFEKKIFLMFPYFDGIHRFLPALFKGYGYNTKFISVDHRQRKYGKSKYGTFKRLLKGIRDIFIVKRIISKK